MPLDSFPSIAQAYAPFPDRLASASAFLFLFVFVLFLLFVVVHERLRTSRLSTRLRNKHVWITGASQGLGLSLTRIALVHGAKVTLTSRSRQRLLSAADTLAAGPRVAVAEADVASSAAAVRAAHAAAVRTHGPVDVAIANAGVNHGGKPFDLVGDDEAETVVGVNLLGVVRVFAAALPAMQARRDGVVCAVGSLAGYRGVPGASVYGATKAGVSAFCESLNVELVGSGVGVVCACPGFVDTPAIAGLDHAKPLLLSADAAAELVLDAVVCRTRHVGFPWLMDAVVMRFARAVPSPAYEWILHFTGDHRAHYAKEKRV